MSFFRVWTTAAFAGFAIAGLAWWRRALTTDGAVAASVVGTVTFARGGLPAAAALLAFFISSTALSRVAVRTKSAQPLAQAKGARRDAWQVLANGGVATLCAGLGWKGGQLGAIAAAAADTWATELGMLARRPPRLITSLQPVPPGTSGGVTGEGFLASLGGALAVAASQLPFSGHDRFWRTTVCGVGGSVVDSLLGATLQAAYFCQQCQLPTEEPVHVFCGCRTELKHGFVWMTNDSVNALSTLAGALIGLL